MDPAVVKNCTDAFKKAYDDPKAIELFERFDFSRIYLSTEDYAKEIPKQYEYKHQNFGAGRTDQELTAAETCAVRGTLPLSTAHRQPIAEAHTSSSVRWTGRRSLSALAPIIKG